MSRLLWVSTAAASSGNVGDHGCVSCALCMHLARTRWRVGFMMNTLHLLQVLVFATAFLASIPSGIVNETRVWKKL